MGTMFNSFLHLKPDTVDLFLEKPILNDQPLTISKTNLKEGIYTIEFSFQRTSSHINNQYIQIQFIVKDKAHNILKEAKSQLFASHILHPSLIFNIHLTKKNAPAEISFSLQRVLIAQNSQTITTTLAVPAAYIQILGKRRRDLCSQFDFSIAGEVNLEPSELEQLKALSEIPPAEKKKALEAFQSADTDHNGQLDEEEFFKLLTEFYPTTTRSDCKLIMCQLDTNRNGLIDVAEWFESYAFCGYEYKQFTEKLKDLKKPEAGPLRLTATVEDLPTDMSPLNLEARPALAVGALPNDPKQVPSGSLPSSPAQLPLHAARLNTSLKAAGLLEWEVPFAQIRFGDKLGEGTFGIVHKAKWRGITVAVKQLKFQNLTQGVLDEFQKELVILGKLRHPNVVLFMGACTHPPNLVMVTEFLSGGSLFDLIHTRKISYPLTTRLNMAYQAALGMNYLHLSDPPILHRDLKSMNLLVDSNMNIKLCDFGLSCIKPTEKAVSEAVGSPFWMAPEVIMAQFYDQKADVYSYGVCVFEIMTGTVPFSELVTSDPSTIQLLYDKVCTGERAPIPYYVLPDIAQFISKCWADSPAQRPTFEEIITQIEQIERSLQNQQISSPYPGYYYDPHQQQYLPYQQVGYYQQNYSQPYQQQYQQYQQQYQQQYYPQQ